jgi:hypothetical protein
MSETTSTATQKPTAATENAKPTQNVMVLPTSTGPKIRDVASINVAMPEPVKGFAERQRQAEGRGRTRVLRVTQLAVLCQEISVVIREVPSDEADATKFGQPVSRPYVELRGQMQLLDDEGQPKTDGLGQPIFGEENTDLMSFVLATAAQGDRRRAFLVPRFQVPVLTDPQPRTQQGTARTGRAASRVNMEKAGELFAAAEQTLQFVADLHSKNDPALKAANEAAKSVKKNSGDSATSFLDAFFGLAIPPETQQNDVMAQVQAALGASADPLA